MVTMTAAASPQNEKTFLGHPRGLFVLFFTEMWERFSYYGMRSILVLYMVRHLFIQPDVGARVLGFNALKGFLEAIFRTHYDAQPLSSQIYGLYTGLVYFTPFFGGMLADRVLGQRKTVVVGGVLMAIGHFMMASERMFFPALMFLILGNGCFKPNISTQVGLLYPPGDPRRDRAFSIFYVGINLGAFFAPIVCGSLGQSKQFGWHWGFAAAGVGMILGLIIYLLNQKYPRARRADATQCRRTRREGKEKRTAHPRGVAARRSDCCRMCGSSLRSGRCTNSRATRCSSGRTPTRAGPCWAGPCRARGSRRSTRS